MNVVFFLLVTILGSHVEGIKIRATRRRFIEYPRVSETKYEQTVPIRRDPGIHNYVDRSEIRYNTNGGDIRRNSEDTINKPRMFWSTVNEPGTFQLGESRSGLIEDDEQKLPEEEKQSDNSVARSDSSSSQGPSSEIGDQKNYTLSLNSAESTKIHDVHGLSESDAATTGRLSATIDNIALNNDKRKNQENIGLFISTNKGNINTVDESGINVNNYEKSPLRYTAVEYNMLPSLRKRLYSVDGIKINKENEAPLYNVDEVRVNNEDTSGMIHLVPQYDRISLDVDSKYSIDKSKYNLRNIAPLEDDEDKANSSNGERISLASEFLKRAPLKNIVQVINVDDKENMVPVHLTAENDLTSTGDDSKYYVDKSRDANTKDANYTYSDNEKEEKDRVPFYPSILRPNQQHVYKPRNTLWKKVNISRGKQPHSSIHNTRRNRLVNLYTKNTSLLNKLISKLCLKCKYLMKALNLTQNVKMLNGLFDNLETSSFENDYDYEYEYEDNINNPARRISWDYLLGGSREKPMYDVRYYQPHTQFTKVLKEDNPQINTVKSLYGYRGSNTFEQPQLYPAELVDDKIDTILPNAYKPQVYRHEPINNSLESYIFMKGNKNFLQTPISVERNQRPPKTQFDFSKPTREILQLEDMFEPKEYSGYTPRVDYLNNEPEQLAPSVIDASKIHIPYNSEIHDIINVPEYLLPSKSPDSSEASTTHTPDTPEELLTLNISDATEILASFTPLVTHSNKIPEELLFSKATQTPDLSAVSTSVPTDWNTTPEELLKAPNVFDSTTYAPFVFDQNDGKTTPEESMPSKYPNTYETPSIKTTVKSDWITITEELKRSEASDASEMPTTYSPLVTHRKDENTTPNEVLFTKASKAVVIPTSYAPFYRKDETIIPGELPSKASKAFETPTTNPPLLSNRKDGTTVLEEFPSKGSETQTTNPQLVTNRQNGTTVREELPSKASEASETPTMNPQLVTNRKDGTTVPEELPSKASEESETPTTNPPIVNNRNVGTTVPEELPSNASEASKTPATNPPITNNRKDGTTVPEKLLTKVSDAGDISTRYVPLASYRIDRKTTPKEVLFLKASDASKKSTTYAPHVTNEKEGNIKPEKRTSKSLKTIQIPTTPTRLATDRKVGTTIVEKLPSKSLDAIDITTTDVPLATHRNLITVKWFPSEPEVTDISTTYVSFETDQSAISEELLTSKATEASVIPTTPTPLAIHLNVIPEKSLPSKTSDAIDISTTDDLPATDQNAISEEFLRSKPPEAIYISTIFTPLATHMNTITEKSLLSKIPDAIDISTTDAPLATYRSTLSEKSLPPKVPEAIEMSLHIPLTTHRNTIPEKFLPSKAPSAADIPTTTTLTTLATGQSSIPEELLPSKVPYVSAIPVSVIHDGEIPELSESQKALDETKIPTSYAPIPAGWAIITKEKVPSKVSVVLNISTTDIPDNWKKPEQMLSQAVDQSKIVTTAPIVDDWIDIPKKTLLSKRLSKLGLSFMQSQQDENNQSEQLPNLENTTPEQYIRQVIKILIPDLLELYSSKCHKGVDEELLLGFKAVIDSVQQRQCQKTEE